MEHIISLDKAKLFFMKIDIFLTKLILIVWFSPFLAELLPTTQTAGPETREFLLKVIEVLLDFVKATNDRNEKVLDFHHPEEMKRLLDLDVPDRAVNLQQLIEDCATTLKYQVKTGKYRDPYLFERLVAGNEPISGMNISQIVFCFAERIDEI